LCARLGGTGWHNDNTRKQQQDGEVHKWKDPRLLPRFALAAR
jgi:hypothetical protein